MNDKSKPWIFAGLRAGLIQSISVVTAVDGSDIVTTVDISIGGHEASTCARCPIFEYEANGERVLVLMWMEVRHNVSRWIKGQPDDVRDRFAPLLAEMGRKAK